MSHYCMNIQDQVPPRSTSLSLQFDSGSNNYAEIKPHQIWRNYHLIKRSDNIDRDKAIGQFETNGTTPTNFSNLKEITNEQKRFSEQLAMTIDNTKSERGELLTEEMRYRHHPSSNTSPGYSSADRSTNPSTPQSAKLICARLGTPSSISDDETNNVANSISVVPSRSVLPSGATSFHTTFSMPPSLNVCTNSAAVAVALHNSRPQAGVVTADPSSSTTGASTSPSSPSLDNLAGINQYPVVSSTSVVNRYPSLSLPPLRIDRGGCRRNAYTSVGLTDMLVGSAVDPITPTSGGGTSALADLTAAVTGQMIVNHTTDGFLHLFHHSTDQRHLPSLVSYEDHNLANPRHLQEYIPSNMSGSYPSQEHQETMLLSQKRIISNATSMSSPAMKRSRRRHEPTIAAAQALVNATSNGIDELSYNPANMANIIGLKMEDRSLNHKPIQPAVSIANEHRVSVPSAGGQLTSQSMPMAYDSHPISRADTSLGSMDDDMCSDPSMLKIEKKRARNRLAARRCRERKVNRIVGLESEVTMLNSYVEQLRVQLETTQKEADRLRHYLEQLSESYPGLQDKLKTLVQPASQVVQSSPGLRAPPLPES